MFLLCEKVSNVPHTVSPHPVQWQQRTMEGRLVTFLHYKETSHMELWTLWQLREQVVARAWGGQELESKTYRHLLQICIKARALHYCQSNCSRGQNLLLVVNMPD